MVEMAQTSRTAKRQDDGLLCETNQIGMGVGDDPIFYLFNRFWGGGYAKGMVALVPFFVLPLETV